MVVAVVNHKGGTGKTTTTVNLGSALAAEGKRVLLVDFDAQGSLTYSLGLQEFELTIAEVLLGEATVADVIQQREGMDIFPSGAALADVELSLARMDDRFHHLRDFLQRLPAYDFILIDCPPSLSLLTINALVACDGVLVPMQMDVLALRGLDSILATVEKLRPLNPEIEVIGVLPVMSDNRKNIYQEILGHIQTNYALRIFDQSIRACVKAAEAPSFGESVVKYAPSSSTARDFTAFAKELLALTITAHT